MAAIKKLVVMDADDFDNVLDLDNALGNTAQAIREMYGYLALATGKQAYATAAMAQYEFESGIGFQDAIYDLCEAITLESVEFHTGSINVSETSEFLSFTPKVNARPLFVLAWRSVAPSGTASYPVLMSAYIKVPITPPSANQPQWAQDNNYAIIQDESGSYSLYNTDVTDGCAANGTITFGTKTNTRRYYAGSVYRWIALYGEVYS